jgi:alpha-N-acetylglucosaminidase
MVGVGITPEGINQNYAVYEFALEMGWTPQNVTGTEAWFRNYPAARYGKEDGQLSEAWRILQQTVYSYKGAFVLHGKYTICRRPSLKIYPFVSESPVISQKYYIF